MADIALTTANRVEVVKVIEMCPPLIAAEAITAGAPIRLDTSSGKATNANATTAAEARVYGIATKTVAAGEAISALRIGIMDGFALSDSDYDKDMWLSDTDGRVADAAGTVNVAIGRVVPGIATTIGTAADKLLYVEITAAEDTSLDSLTTGAIVATTVTASGAIAANGGITVPTGDTVALTDADSLIVGGVKVPQVIEVTGSVIATTDMIDQHFFVANRAYQVTAVREVHTVAESGGTLGIAVKRCTGTQAPASGTAVLQASFNGVATAETVQAGTLSATATDLQLAAGDRLALDFTGDVAGELSGVHVTVSLKAI